MPDYNKSNRVVGLLAGPVIAAVAIDALIAWPAPMAGVRALATRISASPGGVSQASRRLVDAGLFTEDRRATSDLFWAMAREWRPAWREVPHQFDDPTAEVGLAVAASMGAPTIASAGATPEFLVATDAALALAGLDRRADDTMCRAAIAPSPLAIPEPGSTTAPVIVALTLATDQGRGSEIVETWGGDHVWN